MAEAEAKVQRPDAEQESRHRVLEECARDQQRGAVQERVGGWWARCIPKTRQWRAASSTTFAGEPRSSSTGSGVGVSQLRC